MWYLYSVLLLVVSLAELSFAATTYELEAKEFIADASERYYKFYDNLGEQLFSSEDESSFEELLKKLDNINAIAEKLGGISKEAGQFDLHKIEDPQIITELKNLRKMGNLYVLGQDYISVGIFLHDIEEYSTDKEIDPYPGGADAESKRQLALYPQIQQIFEQSKDPEELKYYWESWRTKNLEFMAGNLETLVEAYQNSSEILEIPVLELWYSYYSNRDFLQEMEKVMEEIKPVYQQLHAFVRQELFKKYGVNVIDPHGPIPAHLFEQVLKQVWKEGSVIEEYFPLNELPPYNDFVKDFDAKKAVDVAENFFTSLGFEELGEKFHQTQLTKHGLLGNVGDCKTTIFDLTPHVYMKYCEKVDFKRFLQNHGYLSRIYYAREKKDLPAFFFNSYGLEYPVGEAVILSASTPKHLETIGLAKNFHYTDKVLTNRLLRMSIHTMFNVPNFFVHTKVMNDLLEGIVERDSVNKLYWELMEKYVGIEPPNDRPEGSIDFPYEFYVDMEQNQGTKKFVSEVLGYQFYRAFCKKISHVGPLHTCDFYGHSEVGNDLRAMMSLGSSKPWNQVVSKVLGEDPTLSGDALLEYYAPVLDWVKNMNSESKVKIGWNASQKKVL